MYGESVGLERSERVYQIKMAASTGRDRAEGPGATCDSRPPLVPRRAFVFAFLRRGAGDWSPGCIHSGEA